MNNKKAPNSWDEPVLCLTQPVSSGTLCLAAWRKNTEFVLISLVESVKNAKDNTAWQA